MENNILMMGFVLKKIPAFEDTYACVLMEEIKALPNGFQIKNGKYKSMILPKFDNEEELSIFPFNAYSFIESGIYKDVDEMRETFTCEDKCPVFRFSIDYNDNINFTMLKDVFTDMIDINEVEIFNKDEINIDIESINNEVRQSIIGQDNAIKQILSTIYFNQKLYNSNLDDDKVRNLKQNILLVGSTGVGKTEIIKQIAKQLDIPCVIEDATRYTISGYKGNSVEDMITHLYETADYDSDLAERGILVIDEIDKKSTKEDVSSISSTGVQQSLLKLIEGTKYNISGDTENFLEPFEFDSSFLTVILCGAFSHMDEKKKEEKVVGFTSSKNINEKKSVKDFKDSGIIPELMGRMSKIIQLNTLEEKDFIKILKESSISPLKLTKEFYASLGVEVFFTDSFINDIARIAKEKDIGARGLKTAFDETIDTLEFEVLSGNILKIIFNRADDVKIIRKDVKKKELIIK